MDGNFVNFIMQEVLQDVRRASAQLVRDGLLAPDIEQRFLDAHGCRIDVPHDPAEVGTVLMPERGWISRRTAK
jgi:hypothetical protein